MRLAGPRAARRLGFRARREARVSPQLTGAHQGKNLILGHRLFGTLSLGS